MFTHARALMCQPPTRFRFAPSTYTDLTPSSPLWVWCKNNIVLLVPLPLWESLHHSCYHNIVMVTEVVFRVWSSGPCCCFQVGRSVKSRTAKNVTVNVKNVSEGGSIEIIFTKTVGFNLWVVTANLASGCPDVGLWTSVGQFKMI